MKPSPKIWSLAQVVVACLVYAGTATESVAQQPSTPVKGEITFAWFGGQDRVNKTDKIIKLFQGKYPGVSIVEQNSDWNSYWTKRAIEASAGNIPCTLMMQNRWLATFANPKILRPLDDLVKSGQLDTRGIPPSVLESSRGADGKLYQLPSSVFFNGVIFNLTWLQKAGIKVPTAAWSWDDLATLLQSMKFHVPKGAVPAHNMAMEVDLFVNWAQSHGDKVFENGKAAFSKQTVVDWFSYWERLRKAGVTDTPDVMVEENDNLIEQSDIANGRAFMTARPPNRLDSHQKVLSAVRPGEQLAVLPTPVGPSGGAWDIGSNGIAIGAGCPADRLPVSIAWSNFFTQEPKAAAIYQSDLGPVAVEGLQQAQVDDPSLAEGLKAQILLYRELAPQAKPILWPANSNALLSQALSRNYQAIAFGQMTVDQGAAQMMIDMSSSGK